MILGRGGELVLEAVVQTEEEAILFREVAKLCVTAPGFAATLTLRRSQVPVGLKARPPPHGAPVGGGTRVVSPQLTQNEVGVLAGFCGGAVLYGEAPHYCGAPLR